MKANMYPQHPTPPPWPKLNSEIVSKGISASYMPVFNSPSSDFTSDTHLQQSQFYR